MVGPGRLPFEAADSPRSGTVSGGGGRLHFGAKRRFFDPKVVFQKCVPPGRAPGESAPMPQVIKNLWPRLSAGLVWLCPSNHALYPPPVPSCRFCGHVSLRGRLAVHTGRSTRHPALSVWCGSVWLSYMSPPHRTSQPCLIFFCPAFSLVTPIPTKHRFSFIDQAVCVLGRWNVKGFGVNAGVGTG